MHRFFLTDTVLIVETSVDLAPIAHQLRSVLRLRPGDQIRLLDNRGSSFLTEIEMLDRGQALGRVRAREAAGGEPPAAVVLYQCALKADKFEWVLQKATEIGVTHFVPVISSRTIVRPTEKLRNKYDRWQAILREAAEQSGRGRLPELADPLSWEKAVNEATGVRLLPWEETSTTARLDAAVPREATSISLLIGPEGGISQDEADLAFAAGWRGVSLGPRVLRAETAALVAAALTVNVLEQASDE
ncbi:MAG: 16S rRNA (uracil(1498)-N(3))-methyltransferase [Caldilineaceae bacterium]|nr:16S rRNA (uracil(1498)-N(3))-methyltransferase [Caldilineaceae bacterium]